MKPNTELSRLENTLTALESTVETEFLFLLNEMEPALYNKQTEIAQHENNIAQFQQSYKKLCLAITEKQGEIKSLRHKKLTRLILQITLGSLIAVLTAAIVGTVAAVFYSDVVLLIYGLALVLKSILLMLQISSDLGYTDRNASNTSMKKLKVEKNHLETQLQEIKSTVDLETRQLTQMKNCAKQEVNQLTDKCYDFFTQRKMPQARKSLLNEQEERVALNLVA